MGIINPYIIFIIDDRSFLEYFKNGDERRLRKSWKLYERSTNHLVIERPTSTVHEAAKGAFEALFALWAARDLNHPLIATGNASFQGTSNTEQAADSGWRPGYSTGGRETDWPTIAVEVVWTERRIQVEEDVKFWLTQSSGHVNVAVTVTVHNWGRISVEEWASRVPFLARESKLYLTQRRIVRECQGASKYPMKKYTPSKGQATHQILCWALRRWNSLHTECGIPCSRAIIPKKVGRNLSALRPVAIHTSTPHFLHLHIPTHPLFASQSSFTCYLLHGQMTLILS